jgi:hypothetical protein
MLGKFGSPAAESALWERYTSWNAKWAGRESQLDLTIGDRVDERTYELGLGQNLMQALAKGKSWLSDKNKLQRLLQMTKVRRPQQDLELYLKNWQNEPLTITIDSGAWPTGFHARLAQYEFQSLKALKEKISQFPSGTKFSLSILARESAAEDQSVVELRAFLTARGAIKDQ